MAPVQRGTIHESARPRVRITGLEAGNNLPAEWLTDKRRKLKLRTGEEAVDFITWKRPKMVTEWARNVNLPNVLQRR